MSLPPPNIGKLSAWTAIFDSMAEDASKPPVFVSVAPDGDNARAAASLDKAEALERPFDSIPHAVGAAWRTFGRPPVVVLADVAQ